MVLLLLLVVLLLLWLWLWLLIVVGTVSVDDLAVVGTSALVSVGAVTGSRSKWLSTQGSESPRAEKGRVGKVR